MSSYKNYQPAKALTTLFVVFIVTAFLERDVQEGMFFDGLTYASIARNMAIGKGSTWHLYFRGGPFNGHPPLMFWLQSGFFRLLGDHYFTEKIFCFVVWAATILLLRSLWLQINKSEIQRPSFGFMLLAWGIMPTVMWSYPNNMLDTLMCLFDLATVALLYHALSKGRLLFLSVSTAGVFIFLAVFTKGPIGLFPVCIPVVYWLVYKGSFAKGFMYSLLLMAIVAGGLCGLLLFPSAKASLLQYFNEQITASLSGKTDVTGGEMGRLSLFPELFWQLVPSVILVALPIVIVRIVKKKWHLPTQQKPVWFFLLVAISASVPIVLSAKQRSFYFIPSLPYYAIALSLVVVPAYNVLTADLYIRTKTLRVLNTILLLLVVGSGVYVISRVGAIGRDEELIRDLKTLKQYFAADSMAGICYALEEDYTFLSYMERYNRQNVTTDFKKEQFVIFDKNICGEPFTRELDSAGYVALPQAFNRYVLYKKKR